MYRLFLFFLWIPVCGFGSTFKESKSAEVLRVVDGDTFDARIQISPGYSVETKIRMMGIDTPERSSLCAKERDMAEQARALLERTLTKTVLLKKIKDEKYGRALAEVFLPNGTDVSKKMLESPLVRPYQGKKRLPWCRLITLDKVNSCIVYTRKCFNYLPTTFS